MFAGIFVALQAQVVHAEQHFIDSEENVLNPSSRQEKKAHYYQERVNFYEQKAQEAREKVGIIKKENIYVNGGEVQPQKGKFVRGLQKTGKILIAGAILVGGGYWVYESTNSKEKFMKLGSLYFGWNLIGKLWDWI